MYVLVKWRYLTYLLDLLIETFNETQVIETCLVHFLRFLEWIQNQHVAKFYSWQERKIKFVQIKIFSI